MIICTIYELRCALFKKTKKKKMYNIMHYKYALSFTLPLEVSFVYLQ